MQMDGILVVHKPAGVTSHDVVQKIRKLLKTKKVGHTGTLDPDVTGVLPICIGRGTKLVQYLIEEPKTYIAEWTAGISTDTEDGSGVIVENRTGVMLSRNEIIHTFQSFIGEYEQTPPMYSAVKIGGKKLYELARAGEIIERPHRTVHIYEMDILNMELDVPYPKVTFQVHCSKGTYIRTLCVDIGRALHVPAHMSQLTRIESAGYHLRDAWTLEEIEQAVLDGSIERLVSSMDTALNSFPQLIVPEHIVPKILNGRPILPRFPLPTDIQKGTRIRVISPEGKLLAIHIVMKTDEIWSKPEKILLLQEQD